MATIIVTEIETNEFTVNGKKVYRDSTQQWRCQEELTPAEQLAFREHLTAIGETV